MAKKERGQIREVKTLSILFVHVNEIKGGLIYQALLATAIYTMASSHSVSSRVSIVQGNTSLFSALCPIINRMGLLH